MKEYVFDANALIRLYRNAPGADTVENLIRQAKVGRAHLSISVVNLAEVFYVLAQFLGKEKARRCIEHAHLAVESVAVREVDAINTGALRFHHKLGLADCFAAELALRLRATLVTADPEFVKLGRQLKVLALPRHTK